MKIKKRENKFSTTVICNNNCGGIPPLRFIEGEDEGDDEDPDYRNAKVRTIFGMYIGKKGKKKGINELRVSA